MRKFKKLKFYSGFPTHIMALNHNFGSAITFEYRYRGQRVMIVPAKYVLEPFFQLSSDAELYVRDPALFRRVYVNDLAEREYLIVNVDVGYCYVYLEEEPLQDKYYFENFVNTSVVLADELLLEKVRNCYKGIATILFSLARASNRQLGELLAKSTSEDDARSRVYASGSLVSHVQPKYVLNLEEYLTDEDIANLQEKIKQSYPQFPKMGNLFVSEEELEKLLPFDAPGKNLTALLDKIVYKGAPYGFEGVSIEEYKNYLLDFYGPSSVNYSNLNSRFLEDYNTIEDLVRLGEVLRPRDGAVYENCAPREYDSSTAEYKRYVFQSLFWQGISKIKI